MGRSYLTSKQMAEVLKISEHELLELVKNKQIPFEVTDEGTVYQAYRFTEEDVLKAFKPRETEEEETVKEPEPEEPAEEEAEAEKAPEEEAAPEPEQPSEKAEDKGKDPFEEGKEEESKK
ncbi:hypothetical protein ES705_21379 [subsurface metagenome]